MQGASWVCIPDADVVFQRIEQEWLARARLYPAIVCMIAQPQVGTVAAPQDQGIARGFLTFVQDLKRGSRICRADRHSQPGFVDNARIIGIGSPWTAAARALNPGQAGAVAFEASGGQRARHTDLPDLHGAIAFDPSCANV